MLGLGRKDIRRRNDNAAVPSEILLNKWSLGVSARRLIVKVIM